MMKTRTDIHAGADVLRTCQKERDYWKAQADSMEWLAKSGPVKWPQPQPVPQPLPQPLPQPQPVGGGWVDGVYFADRSGLCG